MKHIILILSDQHNGRVTSLEDSYIDTPNIEKIAQEGVWYPHAYCNAPLCGPSRMSFLSGAYPSDLHIFNNDASLPCDIPTLAHRMGANGYRCVLIGRMHFKGDDQLHGFDERYVGDITSQYWGTGGKQREDFLMYQQTTNRKHCLQAVGAGISPVMVYDEAVYEEAMQFLAKPQKQPLFLVIGFYGPHFPYTCETSLYEKYSQRLLKQEWLLADEYYENYVQEADADLIHACKASYYGLVETLDTYIGSIYDQIKANLKEYLFVYTSDHGEQFGKRNIFGKQTLYEDAIRIPLIMAGTHLKPAIKQETVSLLDVGKTIAAITDCNCTDMKGHYLKSQAISSWIRSEILLDTTDGIRFAQCIVSWPYKLVKLHTKLQLFDLSCDSDEQYDIVNQHPDIVIMLSRHLVSEQQADECIRYEIQQRTRHQLLKLWGQNKRPIEQATVTIPKGRLEKAKR